MKNLGLGTWIARRRVKSRGDIALVSERGELRYEEFSERIARLADALAARGVGRRDRVAYLGNNHPDFLTAFFACGSLGAVFVPLNTRLAARELEYMIEDSGAKALIAHDSLRDLGRAASWGSGVTHRIIVDGPAEPPAVEAFDEVIASGSPRLRDVEVSFDDPAMILYTSGTTGHPKGAVLTHGNLTWNSLNAVVDYDITSESVALLIAPMFHVASLSMGALPALLKGATIVLHDRFEAGAVLEAIERHRITSLSGVPTTFQLLAEHPAWEGTDLSSVRSLTCGGSSVPLRVIEAYERRGLSFSSGYGMTETAPGATSLPPSKARDHLGSSGLAHFFTDVRIVSPEGRPLPAGETGEIQVAGPNVITEYWQRPDATRDAFDGEWFRSGDIGHLDEDGYIFISDRLKDMIISGGENIYPAEVEQLVMSLPEVSSVAVIGVPDDRWGEVPMAVVVRKDGAEIGAEEIIGHVTGRLAKYKVPKAVVFVDDLPRTASGKVRKTDLRATYTSLTSTPAPKEVDA